MVAYQNIDFIFLFYFVKCPYKMNLDFLYIGCIVFFLIAYICLMLISYVLDGKYYSCALTFV